MATPKKTTSSKSTTVAAPAAQKVGFFKRILKSFKGPEVYEAQKSRSFWAAAGELLLVTSFTTLIFAVVATVMFTKFWPELEAKLADVGTWYPADLVLTVQDGVATASPAEPYVIPLNELFDEQDGATPSISVIVDTITPFTVSAMQEYGSGIWISRDAVAIYNADTRKIEQHAWNEFGDFTLNQEMVETLTLKAVDFIHGIAYTLIAFGWFFMSLAITAWRLFYLLFFALVVQFIAWVSNAKSLEYAQAYKIGALAFIPAIFITTVVQMTSIWTGFYGFTFFFSLISAIFVAINLKREKA